MNNLTRWATCASWVANLPEAEGCEFFYKRSKDEKWSDRIETCAAHWLKPSIFIRQGDCRESSPGL